MTEVAGSAAARAPVGVAGAAGAPAGVAVRVAPAGVAVGVAGVAPVGVVAVGVAMVPHPVRAQPPGAISVATPPADTAVARAFISCLSLSSLAVGVTALSLGVDPLRTACFLVFCVLGVGSAPWQLDSAMRLAERLALTVLTGLAVLTIVPMTMIAIGQWRPALAFATIAAVSAPLHVVAVRRALRDARVAEQRYSGVAAPRAGGPVLSRAVVCAVAGAVLCLVAALTHHDPDPGVGGFLATVGPVWYTGLALVLTGLALARRGDERHLAVAVVALLLVITVTPAVVYAGPRSQSAAKHVDLVQQIRMLHRPDSVVPVYNSWSGFFAAMAWLCDIAGIRDPMRLATFWPALVGLLRLAVLRHLFGQVLSAGHLCWLAAAFAVLADPNGMDYFSPQSIGVVFGVGLFGMALSRRIDRRRLTLLFLAGYAMVMSHQLSPFVVGGVLTVLVVFRQVRPWWTPLLVLAPAVLWTLLHRSGVSRFLSVHEIGRLQNFRPPKTVGSPGLERLPIVSVTVWALLLGVGIVGVLALVGLVRHRREARFWAIACCPAVGLALVAVNPYGNEGIFRAMVFGVPWLALLAATRFTAFRRVPVLATTAAVTVTYLVAAFGLDATNVSRPADVAAFAYFRQEARQQPATLHYLLQLGPGDLPGPVAMTTANYRFLTREYDIEGEPVRQELVAVLQADRQVERLTAKLLAYSREPLGRAHFYAIWSPVSAVYAHEYALQLPGQFATLRNAFHRSPYWDVGFQRNGTVVFRFEPARYGGGAR